MNDEENTWKNKPDDVQMGSGNLFIRKGRISQ
jgi:hypothetical protein